MARRRCASKATARFSSAVIDQAAAPFGRLLRHWRTQRHGSQLALALQADVSMRHLSWLETGKSQPSRAMVLRLAEQLDVPLRERNAMLSAAGYALQRPMRCARCTPRWPEDAVSP